MKKGVVALFLLTIYLLTAVPAQAELLMGTNDATGLTEDVATWNSSIDMTKFTALSNGTAETVYFYVHTYYGGACTARAAIYDDDAPGGRPGTLLAYATSSTNISASATWHTSTLDSSALSLTAGNSYFIAVWGAGICASGGYRDGAGTTQGSWRGEVTPYSWPSSSSGIESAAFDREYAYYVDGTATGGGGGGAPVGIRYAASCSDDDIQEQVNSASDGDTIVVPAGDCTWDEPLLIGAEGAPKAVILQGAGCTRNATTGRVESSSTCGTTIRDGMTTGQYIIRWWGSAGYPMEFNGFKIINSARTVVGDNVALFSFIGNNQAVGGEQSTLRITGNYIAHGKTGRMFWIESASPAVISKNYLDVLSGTNLQVFMIGARQWWSDNGTVAPTALDGGYASWRDGADYGTDDFTIIENNTIIGPPSYSCLDSSSGGRFVMRFNSVSNCVPITHGWDSGGYRIEASFAEVYENTFDLTTHSLSYMGEMRDGTWYFFNNDFTNMDQAFTNYGVWLKHYRQIDYYQPSGQSDGRNPADVNDAGNPFNPGSPCTGGSSGKECTTTSASGLTVTVSGASWTTNQWAGYFIRKTTNCTPAPGTNCSSPVASNTSNTITFLTGNSVLSFASGGGDRFELNKVTHAMFQPGRAGGTMDSRDCPSISSSGTTVTLTCTGADFTMGRYYMVDTYGSAAQKLAWGGPRTPTAVSNCDGGGDNCTTMTYTGSASETSSLGSGYTVMLIVPSSNDQTTKPALVWSNVNTNSSGTCTSGCELPASVSNGSTLMIRSLEHYFTNDPANTAYNGTVAAGRNPIGIGTVPGSCTPGANGGPFFWETDAGTWNSLGDDGILRYCSSTDTWSTYYTPYQYPHALETGARPTVYTVTPSTGLQGQVVDVTIFGADFSAGSFGVEFDDVDVSISNVSVVNNWSATARLTIGASADTGTRYINTTTVNGDSAPALFTISTSGPGSGRGLGKGRNPFRGLVNDGSVQ